jgi:hypothetical protein
MVCGQRLFTDRGYGSIWPAASDPGLLEHDRPHQADPAGLARASSSRSTGRRAGARSLRSARESPFRSREAPDYRPQKDPCPRRAVARSCSRPDDRSEVSPPGSRAVYDGLIRAILTLCVLEQPNRRPRLLQRHNVPADFPLELRFARDLTASTASAAQARGSSDSLLRRPVRAGFLGAFV